jgi:hypothetical protein
MARIRRNFAIVSGECAARRLAETVGGDVIISVDAQSGEAVVAPTLRTDPRELGELRQ